MTHTEHKHVADDRMGMVYDFLQSESTLVLSTKNPDGLVNSAPLFYSVTENLNMMWLSSEDTNHSKSVRMDPRASVAVFRSSFDWRKIAGVQMHGLCSIVEGADRTPILDAYCSRFQLGSVLSCAVSRSLVYQFRPQWIRYIDNQKRFGYKFELVL
jgi:hypothetical protein